MTLVEARVGVDEETLTRSVYDAIAGTVFPSHVKDPAFSSALSRCVCGNVRSVLDIAAARLEPQDSDPRPALAFAEVVADLGIPFGTLERAYWVGVEQLVREWIARSRTDPTSAVFPYVMHVLDLARVRYEAVAQERASSGEDRRRSLVDRLLAGAVPESTQELENTLRYRLRGVHVALLFDTAERAAVQRTVARLCAQTGAWGSLAVPHGASSWVAWLGYPTTPDTARLSQLRSALSSTAGAVAVGGPAAGVDGFRRSHVEASRAARLRPVLASPPDCLWYSDVRLEAFLLDNADAAHRFVAEELGELAEGNERARRIRETLLVSLATGSQARAAAELGVHENTVRLRLRSAAEVLGDSLSDRRTELLVALRLCQALGTPATLVSVAAG